MIISKPKSQSALSILSHAHHPRPIPDRRPPPPTPITDRRHLSSSRGRQQQQQSCVDTEKKKKQKWEVKGRREERNYRAAHGGTTRLAPPPNTSSIDAIPSELRQIMAFSGDGKGSLDNADRKKGDSGGSGNGKRIHSEDQVQAKTVGNKRKDDKSSLSGVGAEESNAHQKRNKKRKRKEVKDLRFDTAELGITSSKRKERKK
ncbi:uncharacterized protein LOC125831536 [Solanum verrucosum]|nr:uncharacterized protein LOC125831536 [Solanum verrucosum]